MRPLDQKIFDAFKAACQEKQFEVAEHLLQALESLEGEPSLGNALGEAYRFIDDACLDRQAGRR